MSTPTFDVPLLDVSGYVAGGDAAALDELFGLPLAVKQQYRRDPSANRGYSPPESEPLSMTQNGMTQNGQNAEVGMCAHALKIAFSFDGNYEALPGTLIDGEIGHEPITVVENIAMKLASLRSGVAPKATLRKPLANRPRRSREIST